MTTSHSDFFTNLGLQELVSASTVAEMKQNEKLDVTSTPIRPELDDLRSLYSLVRSRKVCTILEFGVGYSSLVMAKALAENKKEFGTFVNQNLRRNNPFEIHCLDNQAEFLDKAKNRFPDDLRQMANFHLSEVRMTSWNGRIATEYKTLPLLCPDFIYLDAPDQFSVGGEISGYHTRHKDIVPMSCDLLKIEHFLLPGTLIVIDGRAANARFLKCNLQRDWHYSYNQDIDQHYFELVEEPLGKFNKRQIDFCLNKN